MTKKEFTKGIHIGELEFVPHHDSKRVLLHIYVIQSGEPWKTAKYIYGSCTITGLEQFSFNPEQLRQHISNQIRQVKEEMYEELLKQYSDTTEVILFTGPTTKE